MASGTVLRYKIGTYVSNAASVFPGSAANVTLKKLMETRFQVTNFNANTAVYHPDNDYGPTLTGLSEGFHVLRTRQFLSRQGRASIYNTSVQTFYYDAQPPAGQVVYPNENDTLTNSTYGVVVRTDPSVTEVWYKILDGDATNDDSATTANNGNGVWVQATPTHGQPDDFQHLPERVAFQLQQRPVQRHGENPGAPAGVDLRAHERRGHGHRYVHRRCQPLDDARARREHGGSGREDVRRISGDGWHRRGQQLRDEGVVQQIAGQQHLDRRPPQPFCHQDRQHRVRLTHQRGGPGAGEITRSTTTSPTTTTNSPISCPTSTTATRISCTRLT